MSMGMKDYARIDKTDLKKFSQLVQKYAEDKGNVQVRTEGSHFNLFFKDPDLLLKISKDLEPWIRSISEPASLEELEFLLDNNNKKVLCDNLPYEKYNFKVVMRNSKVSTKEQFLNWSKNYSEDQIKISGQTEKWLRGQYVYKQDPFFYVRDSAMLTMTRLFLGDGVRKVFEYIPRHSLEKG
jgi:hypothetical protein